MSRRAQNAASPELAAAIDKAVRGDRALLIDLLCRGSGLPGPRANLPLAEVFAASCASIGAPADRLVSDFARLDPELAPGGGSGVYGAGSELEFLPVCGVIAAGSRGAADAKVRGSMLVLLHDAAEDLRFRVREAVPFALETIATRDGDRLLHEVEGWLDGYFHAAAVLTALVRPGWLTTLTDVPLALERFVAAFDLASRAPRAASRYPGFKALIDALRAAIEPLALRFGVAMFDALAGLAKEKDPHLRTLVTSSLAGDKLRSRHGEDIKRVLAAFEGTAKPVRDPRSLPGPTRRRGGGRRR